jgi:hypothetical protein
MAFRFSRKHEQPASLPLPHNPFFVPALGLIIVIYGAAICVCQIRRAISFRSSLRRWCSRAALRRRSVFGSAVFA